jgi:hypothetical protein
VIKGTKHSPLGRCEKEGVEDKPLPQHLMAAGTVVGGAAPAARRTPRSDKPFRSFEGKLGHLFFQVACFALGAANHFIGLKDDGLKILLAIKTGIFKDRHTFNLLFSLRK